MGIDFKNITNKTDFERFCCEVAKDVFGDFLASRYGRDGQKQHGIDIRSQDFRGRYGRVVIQCKFNQATDGKSVLKEAQTKFASDFQAACNALQNALDFDTFIYAGLWPSDTELKNQASEFEQQTQKKVVVWSLETLRTHVNASPRLQRLYAPQGVPGHGVLLLDHDFWVEAQQTQADPLVFYAGKGTQSGGQQWAGVVHGLAAPRECTTRIHQRLDETLPRLANLEKKVLVVVHGEGGSGKSTLLRRLAFERHARAIEQCKKEVCWWVTNLELFLAHDAVSIQEQPQQTHLLLMEDWYRNVGNAKALAFFGWLKNQPHVAVMVGDRSTSGRAYWDHLHGGYGRGPAGGHEALFALTPQENQATLNLVLERLEALQLPGVQVLHTLLQNHTTLLIQAPLFMTLYVLCHKARQSSPQLDLDDGVATSFARIVSKQVRKLEEIDMTRGLGRALIVQAIIYSAPDRSWQAFSETTLKNTAEFFAGVSSSPRYLGFFQSGHYPSALAALVHRFEQHTKGDRVRFNHDLIAEVGIKLDHLTSQEANAPAAPLNPDFSEVLDGNTLRDLYRHLLAKQDAFGALQLFCHLAHQHGFDEQEAHRNRLALVDLFLKQKRHFNIRALIQSCNDEVSKRDFANAFLSDIQRTLVLWPAATVMMKLLRHDAACKAVARDLLRQNEFWMLPHQIISSAMNTLGANDEVAINAARNLLEQNEFWQLPFGIISTAMNTLGANDEVVKNAARNLLRLNEFWMLPHQIISTAMNALGANDEVAKNAARNLLGQNEFWKLPVEIICTAMNTLGANDEVAKKAARDLLRQNEFWQLPFGIICTAMNALGANDEVAKNAARNLLGQNEFWKLPVEIICTAMNTMGANDNVAKNTARNLLRKIEFWMLPHQIISSAMNTLGANDEVAKNAARNLLEQNEFWQLPVEIISKAMNTLGANDKVAKNAATQILSSTHLVQSSTFLSFAAIKVLAESTDANTNEVLRSLLDALYTKANPSNGEFRLRHDLLHLPLFFNRHFLKLWERRAKAYRSNADQHTIKNIYKILKCQVEYGEQTEEIEYIAQRLCRNISKYCADDVQHQWRAHRNELSLMHIALAFEVMNPPQPWWKLAAITKLKALGRQETGLEDNEQFKQLLTALESGLESPPAP